MSIIGRMIEKIYGQPEVRILLLGLDAAGRTTTLYKLKLGEIVTTIPTIGQYPDPMASHKSTTNGNCNLYPLLDPCN